MLEVRATVSKVWAVRGRRKQRMRKSGGVPTVVGKAAGRVDGIECRDYSNFQKKELHPSFFICEMVH